MPMSPVPFIVAIPARYASTRLPGKPLRRLGDWPLIAHVVTRALEAGAREVIVATDDERIADALASLEVTVCMTDPALASGSDRIAACANQFGWEDEEIVVNLQGDEPFAPAAGIRAVVAALAGSQAPMATLAAPLESIEELFDPNCVKVVRRTDGCALYFSRAPVPWARDALSTQPEVLPKGVPFLRHIGLYAYRAGFLRGLSGLAPSSLEKAESLEQLRALENGHAIQVEITPAPFPPGIDTEEDLVRASRYLGENPA